VGPCPRGARLKGLYVSPQLFARHMRELAEAGLTTNGLPVVQLTRDFNQTLNAPEMLWLVRRRGADTAPCLDRAEQSATGKDQVCVTFDDGFVDVFEHALPVLVERQFVAIEYLVPNLLGKTNEWQQRAGDVQETLMNYSQVREWLGAGQEIGSHTLTHPWLTRVPLDVAREEIVASKKALEDKFSVPIRHFCYPYGDYNEAVRDIVEEAGYDTACTTRTGINKTGISPFELNRFTARYPSRNLKQLWTRLCASWFRR
jgi:peptidoglycan/xylan/chitin deacetylase (PgdA/CDA1 family)